VVQDRNADEGTLVLRLTLQDRRTNGRLRHDVQIAPMAAIDLMLQLRDQLHKALGVTPDTLYDPEPHEDDGA
jgi:hypothetical protein